MPRRRTRGSCCSKRGAVIYFVHAHGRRDGTLSDVPFEVFLGVLHASGCQSGEGWARLSAAPAAQSSGFHSQHVSGLLSSEHLHIAARVLIALVAFSLAYSAFRLLHGCPHGRNMASVIAPLYQVVQCIADASRGDFHKGRPLLVGSPLLKGVGFDP
jgi:hypothetical protein